MPKSLSYKKTRFDDDVPQGEHPPADSMLLRAKNLRRSLSFHATTQ
ncbi:MAG: hypothetical protein AAGA18_08420 [Verrucomicrobiota bacterium]